MKNFQSFLILTVMVLTLFVFGKTLYADQTIKPSEITLYYRPGCTYCSKVLNHFNSIHKAPPALKDLGNKQNLDSLMKMGGKKQVPCLVVKNKPIYESDAIIQWVNSHKNLFQDTR